MGARQRDSHHFVGDAACIMPVLYVCRDGEWGKAKRREGNVVSVYKERDAKA